MLAWGVGKFLLPAVILLLLRTLRRRRRRVLEKGKFSPSPQGIADLKEAYRWMGGVLLALGRTPPRLFRRTPLPALHCERANSATRRAWKELALPGRPPILRRSILLGLLHGAMPSVRGRWRFTSQQAIDAREDIAAALRGAGHPVEKDEADELLTVRAADKEKQRRRMWGALRVGASVGLIVGLTTMTLRILV
ncbi:MAG: hypothetical protein ACI9VR_000281 [Cognaticolwellia sp.]|jgi:hypothetical protein